MTKLSRACRGFVISLLVLVGRCMDAPCRGSCFHVTHSDKSTLPCHAVSCTWTADVLYSGNATPGRTPQETSDPQQISVQIQPSGLYPHVTSGNGSQRPCGAVLCAEGALEDFQARCTLSALLWNHDSSYNDQDTESKKCMDVYPTMLMVSSCQLVPCPRSSVCLQLTESTCLGLPRQKGFSPPAAQAKLTQDTASGR